MASGGCTASQGSAKISEAVRQTEWVCVQGANTVLLKSRVSQGKEGSGQCRTQGRASLAGEHPWEPPHSHHCSHTFLQPGGHPALVLLPPRARTADATVTTASPFSPSFLTTFIIVPILAPPDLLSQGQYFSRILLCP